MVASVAALSQTVGGYWKRVVVRERDAVGILGLVGMLKRKGGKVALSMV